MKGKVPAPAGSARARTAESAAAELSAAWLWTAVLLPLIACVAVFAPAARNGFVWDDPLVFKQLESFRSLGDLFVPPSAVPRFYYRPFIFLTFLIERTFAGSDPWLFHVSVIAWHMAATLLVFVVGRRLLGKERVVEAGIAALLFAVHPLHVESVAWIAGRSDVIATVFVLIALYFSSRVEEAWTAWAAAVSFLIACWAKEVAIAALVLIPARDVLLDKKLFESRYVPIAIAAALYFTTRYVGIGSVGGGLENEADTAQILRDVFAAIGWYAAKVVLPMNLNAYVPQVPQDSAYALLGVAVAGLAGAVALWGWIKGWPVMTFAIIWMALTIAPSLWVVVRRSASAVLAERYAYLPSVGAVWLVGWLLTRARPLALWRAASALVVVLAVAGAVQARQRVAVWADNLSFWSDVASKVPEYALPHRELADALMVQNRLDEAETHYRAALTAISEREGMVMAYNNLGNLLVRRERFAEAEKAYNDGIAIYPHPRLYAGMGRVAIERARRAGNDSEARKELLVAQDSLTRAIAGDEEDYRSHNLLGQVLFNMGKRDEAKRHFERSLTISPNGPVADIARQYLKQIGSS